MSLNLLEGKAAGNVARNKEECESVSVVTAAFKSILAVD
jgi:hypothetical protein